MTALAGLLAYAEDREPVWNAVADALQEANEFTEVRCRQLVCSYKAHDWPRLVYAHWCEVNAGESPCPTCSKRAFPPYQWKCSTCHGTGRVSNGLADRADFVRVQCELAKCPPKIRADRRWGDMRYMAAEPWDSLRRREWELWNRHGVGWVAATRPCPNGRAGCSVSVDFRRGFVAAVTCTAADWLAHADALAWHPGQTCTPCKGTGRWRGYPEASNPGTCDDCSATGTRPFVPTAVPLEEVVLTTLTDTDGYTSPLGVHYARIPGRPWTMNRGENTSRGRLIAVLTDMYPGLTFRLPDRT